MTDLVKYKLVNDIAEITMNDGKVNVMSMGMMEALKQGFERAESEAIGLVLRSSIPGIFSAGFNLKVLTADDDEKRLEMVRTGGQLALQLMGLQIPTLGVLSGHAYPMGTFLLLACDVRVGVEGPHRSGLNEVAIKITPPGFAVELARSRLHPAWLSRTVILGEMFEPEDAVTAGLLDRVEKPENLERAITQITRMFSQIHQPSHAAAKLRLRKPAMQAMASAIESELSLEAFKHAGSLEVSATA